MTRSFAAGCAMATAFNAVAADTAATLPVSPVSGQITSLALSTLLIVVLVVAVAWVLKRLAPRHYTRNNTLRVVAGTAVGQRERIVVVEIANTWLVVGVAPGRVNMLHQLPRAEPTEAADAVIPASHPFTRWLSEAIKKR